MMMEWEYLAESIEETQRLAGILGKKLQGEDVVLLDGDLGAGKTTFTKALAASLGITEVVNSPTFSIVNEYELTEGQFFHFDLYRIDEEEELFDIGFEEYFTHQGIIVIEWAEKFIKVIPEPYIKIYIMKEEGDSRRFRISGTKDERVELLIKELAEDVDSWI